MTLMAKREPLPKFMRVSRRYPCPICGRTKFCSYNEILACCTRVESDRPNKDRHGNVWGWLHVIKGQDITPPKRQEVQQATKLGKENLDLAYRILLHLLPLLPEHKAYLNEQGFSDEEIERRGYRSLPLDGRGEIARKWLSHCPWLVKGGAPGFCYINAGGKKIPFLKGAGGILFPARNEDELIQGFQIRLDNPVNNQRYNWFSSTNGELGCGSGTPYHLSQPAELDSGRALFVTEGIKKADRVSSTLRANVIAVPGVSVWREAIEVIQRIHPAKGVIIAWDGDYRYNEWVSQSLEGITSTLQADGIWVRKAVWKEEDGKGIDDVFANGHAIRIV